MVAVGSLSVLHQNAVFIPTLFRKSVGDIVIASVRPSVCPSVRPSYMLSPPKLLDRIQPNLVSGLLTQVGRATAHLIFGPAPRGPGEGSKGQILTISNFKVNFKDFYAKMCTYTQ